RLSLSSPTRLSLSSPTRLCPDHLRASPTRRRAGPVQRHDDPALPGQPMSAQFAPTHPFLLANVWLWSPKCPFGDHNHTFASAPAAPVRGLPDADAESLVRERAGRPRVAEKNANEIPHVRRHADPSVCQLKLTRCSTSTTVD